MPADPIPPCPERSDSAALEPALFVDALRSLPHKDQASPALDAALTACVFDLRRRLVDRLARQHGIREGGGGREDEEPSARWEEALRASLPPLKVPPGPFVTTFSAWRSSLAAVLGLLAGSGLSQGLLMHDVPGGGGLAVLCGLCGVACALWGQQYLGKARALGCVRLPWAEISWKKFRRFALWGLGAVAVLTVLRDFFLARDALGEVLAALSIFLTQGLVLGLFTSLYGVLLWAGLFAVSLTQTLRLDREAFARNLELVTGHWWAGACRVAELLAENAVLRHEDSVEQWRRAGSDLYSFAAELPHHRREWLEDRLRLLGLEAPRDGGSLVWEEALRDHYEPLGHVQTGDTCYVDQPPLLERGQLLRKGVVRKVRA